MNIQENITNKIRHVIGLTIVSSFAIYSVPSAKAFIPYIYEPNSEELKRTGTSIGKTAIQILQLGQHNEAMRLAELGLSLKPKDYRLWSILGEAQRRSGLFKEAIISLEKATTLNPQKADLWFAIGAIQLERKNPTKALPLLNKGLKLDPKNQLGYFQLGNCRLMQNKFELSLKAFKKALEIKPNFWEALNNQGIIEFEKGETKKAIKTWRKVLTIERNSESMLALSAALNLFAPENRESLSLAKEALKKNPNYVSSSHQSEQLWGDELIQATAQLLSLPSLVKDVERALANSNVTN